MAEEIILYCGEGGIRNSLVRRFKESGLAVKVEDAGRYYPIARQGENFFYGIREICLRYFPKN